MESPLTSLVLREFFADPRNGEKQKRFAEKYLPRLRELCGKLCKAKGLHDEDAEDLTADIFLRLSRPGGFGNYAHKEKALFNAWLQRVAENAVIDLLRRQRRNAENWSKGNPAAQRALEQVATELACDLEMLFEETKERVTAAGRAIRRAMREKKNWTAYWMVEHQNRSVSDAARLLRVNTAYIWKAISRVRAKLRTALPDLFDPPDD